jgi:folylpolyglutamate synthase/dihydropteroate synthase
LPAAELGEVAKQAGFPNVVIKEQLADAMDYAKNLAISDSLAVFATGSLYMVGDLLRLFSSKLETDEDGKD